MNTPAQKNKPLLTRILSLEGAMAAFGLYSLGTGLWEGQTLQIFWGAMILAGLGMLVAVRRRDWTKHWAEMAAMSADPKGPQQPDSAPREK